MYLSISFLSLKIPLLFLIFLSPLHAFLPHSPLQLLPIHLVPHEIVEYVASARIVSAVVEWGRGPLYAVPSEIVLKGISAYVEVISRPVLQMAC